MQFNISTLFVTLLASSSALAAVVPAPNTAFEATGNNRLVARNIHEVNQVANNHANFDSDVRLNRLSRRNPDKSKKKPAAKPAAKPKPAAAPKKGGVRANTPPPTPPPSPPPAPAGTCTYVMCGTGADCWRAGCPPRCEADGTCAAN